MKTCLLKKHPHRPITEFLCPAASIILAKFLLLSSLVFISGCTSFSLPGSKLPEVKQPDLNIAQFIERFSLHTQEATAALTKLNRIEYAKLPVKPAKSSGLIPASLSKQITFGWTGPLDLYVKDLARKSGYSFSTQGNRPPNPVLINIPEQQKSILDHLRESGYQAGPRALVQVDAKLQKIEVIYAN